MKRKMAIKKSLFTVLMIFAALITSVVASPIDVTNLKINEKDGDYIVLVTLENTNVASGVFEELIFTIKELGTSKNVGVIKVDSQTKVLTYNLRELTDSYDLLKKGSTYTLTASTSTSNVSESFLFGSVKTTQGLGLIFDEIEVNNAKISGDVLQVLNGETLDVKFRFTALENFDDARLMVFIEGYEHSTIVASTPIFAVVEGKTYIKTLSLTLPNNMDSQKEYKLRIVGANDLSGVTYKDFNVFVDTQRHRVDIIDMIMTPSSGVQAGQNIIANVRLRNMGQKTQDSVKVTISVPQLNIRGESYVSNLNSGNVITSDDMLLFVPENTSAGQFDVNVILSYNEGFTTTTHTFTMNVLAPRVVAEDNLLVSFKGNVDLTVGDETTIEIVVANPNQVSKPISIVSADNAWATIEVTPSLAMIQGGDSQTFNVKVTPKSSAEGERELSLLIKEGAVTLDEITISTFVEAEDRINIVNVVLAVLLVIAIIILLSLVFAIARRRKEDGDETSSEEYY